MDTRTRNNVAPAHLTLRQLSCFVTVAEECHFRRAAARLHMTQPPLTQRIQDLERDLGVQLFTRTGHRIELTEAGRLVLAEAKATLAQADRVREVARRVRQGEVGVLRVSVRSSVSFVRVFREATEAFRRDCPNVILDFVQTPCHGAIEALHQHKIDACVLRRVGSPPDGLHQVAIASDRLMLVLPSHHPKALAPKVALSDVAEEQFIELSDDKTTLARQIMDLWARTGVAPRMTQKAENGMAILGLVASGFGNAILPDTLSHVHVPDVVWKPVDANDEWTLSSIVMLYRIDARNEEIQSRFVEYVRRFSSGAD